MDEMSTLINKRDEWYFDGCWIAPPLVFSYFSHWNKADILKQLVPGVTFNSIFTVNGNAFHKCEDKIKVATFLSDLKKQNRLAAFAKELDDAGNTLFARYKEALLHGDEYIIGHYDEYQKLHIELSGFWVLGSILGDYLTVFALEEKLIESEADLFGLVQPHLKTTWLEQEVKDVLEIAHLCIDNNCFTADSISNFLVNDFVINEKAKTYVAHYSWSKINKWIGEPITTDHLVNRVIEEIKNIQNGNHVNTAKDVSLLDDSVMSGVIGMCVSFAYWRPQCGMAEMMFAERMRSIFNTIAQANNLEYTDILLLTVTELNEVIKSAGYVILNKAKVLSRTKEYINYITSSGAEIVLTPSDDLFEVIKNVYVPNVDTSQKVTTLKGVPASKGQVTGSVRIVQTGADFAGFVDGEILVAPETTPLFVPLMRMAAAILTGRGGITSHAAIVSRELKKPCIIGIKDVTKILKTGDMVAVDANTGIVTIL